jgi:hypothetical protein
MCAIYSRSNWPCTACSLSILSLYSRWMVCGNTHMYALVTRMRTQQCQRRSTAGDSPPPPFCRRPFVPMSFEDTTALLQGRYSGLASAAYSD